MTPQEFIRKWKPNALTERAAAQEHFIDLCRVFEHPTPAEDDPTGDHFTFEKGAPKTGGGEGYADVWKKGYFAWEYKKKKRDLDAALKQLTTYAAALENPPLHVACDTVRFRIETRWTNEVSAKYEFELDDFAEPKNLAVLRAVFHNPEELRSKRTRAALTKDAAGKFQTISDKLQQRNPDREAVAHFVNQLVFCFFADSVKLLPNGLWKKLLQAAEHKPSQSKRFLDRLFGDMERGGDFDLEDIAHFNGGLFDGRGALALEDTDISLLFAASSLDWGLIDPTIFGTLFERFLDPDKRAQIGAHYTDPDKIMMIVEPVVMRPLQREWDEAKKDIEAIMAPALAAAGGVGRAASRDLGKKFDAARARAEAARDAFIDRLCGLRILDPACGSGNFLYLALQAVKDIEYRAILECETLGLGMVVPRVGPEILHGIEINPFAAELARTTIWIGDIQWRVRNAISHHPRPVLRKLDIINFRDFDEQEAALFEASFAHVLDRVKPFRSGSRSDQERRNWWKLARPASSLFSRLEVLSRFIVVPEVSKHRVFSWMQNGICPDKNLVVISHDDDTTFGILHSRFHEAWSLRLGTSLEDRPRYTPTTTFETFPFPEGLTPNIPAADYAVDPRAQRIAAAAKKLDELRSAWLNPPDLVDIVPEITPTAAPGEAPRRYPDRILPKNVEAAAKLKERTLTNLYNQRPRWLADAHEALDRTVAAAYGWPEDIATEDALARLLTLNLDRAGRSGKSDAAEPSPVRERAG